MVFEAVVVELLNKFLKQYVENLDTSQLKIGIWGGDVVLNDLKIKTTLFDDLNLPVRVKFGKLGRFAMKIPWKNLYSSQVSVNIEELLVVIIPNNEFKYDPVKEEKWANDRKLAKLKAIEEARKSELEPDTSQQKDSFIEKLLTQIIKNIQIVIRNIHIRFEDKTTVPNSPFSVGLTLSNLSAETTATDPSGYFTKMLKENQNYICKIVSLEGLAIYWNSFSTLYSNLPDEELLSKLLNTIPKPGHNPKNVYMFGPLTSAAFLRLNPKPETDGTDFKIPKIFVQIILKDIELAVTHNQFCDCMELLEDSRRLQAANKYRKYRPMGIDVLGHAKVWWHFAYKCVVEDIIRRKLEWNWENIKKHRRLCKRYADLFKQKVTMKKMTLEAAEELIQLEKKLNLLNLILIREQVHMEVERSKVNLAKTDSKSGGWFSGWFSSRAQSMNATAGSDELVKKIESVMTPNEKEKLYKAIGYEESAPPTKYPHTFVEFQFWFNLEEIKMTIYDDALSQPVPILMISVKDVRTEFEQRPSANAVKLVAIVGHFRVIGKADKHGNYPELVTSNCKKSESLIELLYETKPVNESCDQRINVNARPLRIVYHANTINLVREVFTSQAKVEKIVAATSASLPTFQKITALGLQYAIEKRMVLEVKVNVMSSYIIIPYEGDYKADKDMLVIVLGSVNVETEENDQKDVSVRKLYLEGTSDEEIFSTVVSASYTKLKFELTGVQILFQLSGENWVTASKVIGPSPMRFLESTNLAVTIKKSLVSDDARIPKMMIEGTLPNVTFNLSEKRFVSLVALACSIPTKSEKGTVSSKRVGSTWSIHSLGSNLESKLVHLQKDLSLVRPVVEYTQGIDLIGHFEITDVIVNVFKNKGKTEEEKKQKQAQDENFIKLQVTRMGVDVTSKTFETLYLLKLGGMNFDYYHGETIVPVVSTKSLEKKKCLLTVEYVNLDTKIPDFFTKRHAIVNSLTLNTTSLSVLLNKEALLAQIQFVTHIQNRVDEVKRGMNVDRAADAGKLKEEDAEVTGKDEKKVIAKGKRFRKKSQRQVIDLLLVVALEDIGVVVDFQDSKLCEFTLQGTRVNIASRKSYINVDFSLKEIFLLDLNPKTKHKKIVASLENQTLSSKVTVYNKDYFGDENTVDITIDAEVSRIQLIFVNIFFSRAFDFLSAFQSQIESLKEGASVAAQRAKENLLIAYQNQSQVCLNIRITAPILIVPKTSTSMETIVLDMGVLTLKNTIQELDFTPIEGKVTKRPLIDTMKLNLQQLKMVRLLLSEKSSATNIEKAFVVPVSLEITLKRNLSMGWFNVIPDLEVFARLGAIHVKLTHEDIITIAGILRGNLSEEVHHIESKSSFRQKHDRKPIKEREVKLLPQLEINQDKSEKEEMSNNTVVKFVFFLDSVRFDAIVENADKNEEPEGLATFTLETISLKGRMFTDGSIHTSIMLVSCLLDDTRPGKIGRLTRLMERTVDMYSSASSAEENVVNSMIQIRYTKRDLNTFVDMRVYKFTLILSMDFLQKLGEFFTLDETSAPARVEHVGRSQFKENIVDSDQLPTFTVNIRLEKPDIIIVENMDSINTDALIFHTEMVTKFILAGSRQVINSTFTDIELYSCCFNPAKRPYTLSQVIKPFTISAAGSTPEGRGLHIDICLTEISITINPNTIDLLSKCYEALFKDSLADRETVNDVDNSDLWDVKEFDVNDYWFLKPEEGVDVLTQLSVQSAFGLDEDQGNNEICLLAIPLIVLFIEGHSGKRPQPLLMLQMGFQMQCFNWSYKMSLSSVLTLEMRFYNKNLSAWEPVVEPVEENPEKEELHSYTPWELSFAVIMGEEGDIEGVQPPKIQITLSCAEILQLTLTKTCLDVLKTAGDTYTSAVKRLLEKSVSDMPPFVIINKTGLVAELMLYESQLQVCKALDDSYEVVKLESNSEVELYMASDKGTKSQLKLSKSSSKLETKLSIKFPLCSQQAFYLPLGMSSKRFYPFPLGEFKEEVWGLVSDISVTENTTSVILRSILRVQNDFNEPINIHILSENGDEAEFVGTAEGNSSFPLPFHAIYNKSKLLFFSVNGYTLSTEPFPWEQIKNELDTSVLLQCNSKIPENNDPFFMQVVGETEHIYYTNTKRKTVSSMCYVINLQPTVKIFSSLPVALNICFQGVARERVLQPGSTVQITNAEPGSSTITLRICDYLEKEWSCKEKIDENPPEYFIWKFTSYNGLTPEDLNLGVRVTYKKKTAVYSIYCPYFMINKTEHLLAYKFEGNSPAFYHPGDYKQPIMFSPSSKKFFSKKSAQLKLEHSEWSEKFPVDVAGSGGTVECEDSAKKITYIISVTITLTQNNLTKIVTLTPYYIFVNSAPYDIEYNECDLGDYWLEIPSGSCVPFWPESQEKQKKIQIRPKGSTETSPPFAYSSTDNILLRLNHKCGGINADIQATNSGTYIMFEQYERGQAPALILNHSDKKITITEKDTKCIIILQPKQQVLHTWMAPTNERQLILKNPKHSKNVLVVDQDTEGLVFTAQGEAVRYVSFLDGTQRTLLFTDEPELSRNISTMKIPGSAGVEIICKIQGIGLSLVNDTNRVEIFYMSFVSSNVCWESKKSGKMRFKRIKEEKTAKLEAAYQKYSSDSEENMNINPVVSLGDRLSVNFQTMEMLSPHHRKLRRVYEPGVYLAYRLLEGQVMLHVKINRFQIDNQLLDSVFPIILTPVPPPKTVVAELKGPKPFFELSILKVTEDQTGIAQYKYFKILVQEFHVKVDIGLLQQLYDFMMAAETTDEEEKEKFRKELELTEKPLISHVEISSSSGRKNFYELLHFSPLKIHFSFSLAGNLDGGSLPPALSVILQGLGVTLTDINDVIFRLSYFERKSVFLTNGQLTNEVTSHYYGQTIRQAYVLVLGLDVIGNPYGLIVGIGEGVEAFFYEPFQGIVQGPSDFAEGVAIGCKRFFKGAVGSTAGTLEKLTGTLGKGLAVLSLDKEYQMQRMENTQHEETIQASMARGGRGLFMGVFEGVTGVVRKPLEGAREEGVEGFFKGVGKGMMGLVTRPVTGVVDFASTSLNAVKRAAIGIYGNTRVRPPRFFRDECLIQPYNFYDAAGNVLFHSLCKRKYCMTDRYEYHFELRTKEYVILTNKRIILAEYKETFDTWQEHMAITWKSMPEGPRCHTKGVALTLPMKPSGSSRKIDFSAKPSVKILLIKEAAVKQRLYRKMLELYNLEQEQTEFS